MSNVEKTGGLRTFEAAQSEREEIYYIWDLNLKAAIETNKTSSGGESIKIGAGPLNSLRNSYGIFKAILEYGESTCQN